MMKIYQIAYKNLLRKRVRTVLTVIGISLSTWILVSLLGFNAGYKNSLNSDIDNMGFQMLVTAKGCPYEAATLMLKGGTGLRYMNESINNQILNSKEVEATTPMLMHAIFDPNKGENGGITAYLGVDAATFPKMKTYFKFNKGGWFTDNSAHEAVMGYEAAELEQREVGDKILVPETDIELKITGILKRTGTQDDGSIFVPLKTVQKIFHKEGKLTGIGIKIKKEVDVDKFTNKLYDLPDVQVVSLAQVKETIYNLVSTAKIIVFAVAIIAILISIIGVINTIFMSVFERFHEIGILKSMGATPVDIFKLILYETVIICFTGGIIGNLMAIGLSKLTDLMIRSILPYTPNGKIIQIDPSLLVFGLLLVILIGVISGIFPAVKAAKIRPIESIRNEGIN